MSKRKGVVTKGRWHKFDGTGGMVLHQQRVTGGNLSTSTARLLIHFQKIMGNNLKHPALHVAI
eukprot:6290161-Prorocentrum_lima.AAC.1